MTGCFFALAVIFFFIGLVNLLSPANAPQTSFRQQPIPARPARQSTRSPSTRAPAAAIDRDQGGTVSTPSLNNIQIGQRIQVQHPVQGNITLYVMGHAIFDELWQRQKSPQAPWVPTGNAFSGFWLETNIFLLNWQNRYYLLDEMVATSEPEIQRDFAPHARKFAQSDQTAEVYFSYPPAMWKMVDIGKFRVRSVEGEGLRHQAGAVARFIHASGDASRALVLEDYESGGQDVVWFGYSIPAEIIRP